MPTDRNPNVLVAVDDTSASRAALDAAARETAARDAGELVIFHLLPTIPTEHLEHGGRDDPDAERRVDAQQTRQRREWIERKAREQAQPLFEQLTPVAREAGLPDARIRTHYDAPNPECSVAREILRVAEERDCGRIFVGRNAYPWHKELFHKHVGEELVGRADEPRAPQVSVIDE